MVRSKPLLGLSRRDLFPPDKQRPHQLVPPGVFFPLLRRRKFFADVGFFEFLRQRSDVFARRSETLQSVQGSGSDKKILLKAK
jgi:hypothetical protein